MERPCRLFDNTERVPANEGAKRLVSLAAKGDRHDKRLWTLSGVVSAKGSTISLAGTPDQVADALVVYYDLDISIFLIRGFEPLVQAVEYGLDILPRVRALVKQRHRLRQAAEQE